MLKRTAVTLSGAAIGLWILTCWLATDEHAHPTVTPVRAVVQGITITASVIAGLVFVARFVIAQRPGQPLPTHERAAYISTNALRDDGPITMQLPRVREMATVGGRSQDYWDAVADVATTIFERRDDDPFADD